MSNASTVFKTRGRSLPVIPVLSPTVPVAETTSNNASMGT